MSLKDENEKLKEEKQHENENEDDDDIMKILIGSNEYDKETSKQKNKIKKLNDHLDEIIDKFFDPTKQSAY